MPGEKYLLDTHTLLWFQMNSHNLSEKVKELIINVDNQIFFSQISLLEISIKQKIGKIPEAGALPGEIFELAISDGFEHVPLQLQHIELYGKIPLFQEHRDPFDRLLVAQAHFLNASILTVDSKFKLYPDWIKVFW